VHPEELAMKLAPNALVHINFETLIAFDSICCVLHDMSTKQATKEATISKTESLVLMKNMVRSASAVQSRFF